MSVLTESDSAVTLPPATSGRRAQTVPVFPVSSASGSTHAEAMDVPELIRQVSRLIKRETNLGVQDMEVSFEKGCLILKGYCRTFYTKQLAQQAVVTVIGNVELVNKIRVV